LKAISFIGPWQSRRMRNSRECRDDRKMAAIHRRESQRMTATGKAKRDRLLTRKARTPPPWRSKLHAGAVGSEENPHGYRREPQQHERRAGSNLTGEHASSTARWNDVPRGTMDEVSSYVRLNLPLV